MLLLLICTGIVPLALLLIFRPLSLPVARNLTISRRPVFNSPPFQRNLRLFSEDYLLEMEQKSKKCMEEEKPYLDPQLNLVRFSVLVGLPCHHLSHYFRVERGISFTDFRNSWRVRHAQMLIKEGYGEIMTLEAIGAQSGFSSRNAFLTAFKKHEGISPREFMMKITPPRKLDNQWRQEAV